MKYKRLIQLASLLFFAACTTSKTEIHIIGEALPPLESLGEMAQEYEKATGVKVIVHPYEFETALQKTQLDLISGNGDYDIIMAVYFNHGKYYANGDIANLQELAKTNGLQENVQPSAFYPALQEISMFFDSALIGYPFSAQTMFLWFRTDLFIDPIEKERFRKVYGYDLPLPDEENLITWEQYYDLCEFFTRMKGDSLQGKELNDNFYGTTLQLKRHPASLNEFSNYIFSFGGGYYDGQGNLRLDSKENIQALEYYLSLKAFAPPGVVQFTWDDALAQMQQGHIATTIMWSDAPSALYDESASRVAGKIGYSLVPIHSKVQRKVSMFGGWAFCINSDSESKDAAYEFIQWATSDSIQLKWAKSGGLPGAKSIFKDDEYLKIPYMPAQNEALKHLVSFPRDPNAENFINQGIIALSKAANGELSAQEALQYWQSEVEARR